MIMTLSIGISGNSDDLTVSIARLATGNGGVMPETLAVHNKICDVIEPAVYEVIRGLVRHNGIKATVKWDRQIIKVK